MDQKVMLMKFKTMDLSYKVNILNFFVEQYD